MDAQKIGNAIKALRKRRGLTQNQLADCLGVTDKAVSKWERGIGIPDISILTALASLLFVDVDDLLDGRVSFLEESWRGLLILDDLYAGTLVYGKPCVYFSLSYFLLVEIRDVTICCNRDNLDYLQKTLGSGERFGMSLRYELLTADSIFNPDHTMVIFNTPFLYGLNLTRYFQSALVSSRSAAVLTVPYRLDFGVGRVAVNGGNLAQMPTEKEPGSPILPIAFLRSGLEACRCTRADVFDALMQMIPNHKLRVVWIGNGMICRDIRTNQDVLDVSNLVHLLETFSGNRIYCPEDIARARGLIPTGRE